MKPEDFSTLIEMLACRAEANATKVAFTFKDQATTFGKMWQGINQFAGFLLECGIERAEPVIVALPNSAEFFAAFYGIQRAGGIAVPVFPDAGVERIFSLAGLCEARVIVAPSDLSDELLSSLRQAGAGRGLHVVTVTESAGAQNPAQFPAIQPEDIAFLQYTSGSTGNPKGVMLTQAGLMTNIRQIIAGMGITPGEIFVSWLPVYHDMGLILKTMVPFYLAAETHLLPTNLRDARPWLETISRTRATFTAAPDFAYRLILRHITPGDYDLASLRVALNAAEPVRATTARDFESAFDLPNVMTAGYGLAEATVGVSMSQPGAPLRVDRRGFVSVGRPFPDVDLLIVDGDEVLPPGEVGEILICSRANSLGYFRNAAATAELFWREGFFRSGDLGYLDADGFLYIVSRKKNIIKRGGETFSPQEIEEVMDSMPGVRFSAALGIDRGGVEGEQVFVFAETRDGETLSEDARYKMCLGMVERFAAHMGFRPARVYLLRPRSIPLTHNGKIQHARLREMHLDGSLRAQGAILYPDY
jgi:acyl-CoA synthetase (AMP-forming)/AMP-acid ligase II